MGQFDDCLMRVDILKETEFKGECDECNTRIWVREF